MLWIDKYRPRGLKGLSYHDEITKRLQFFADQPSTLPHLLFYGPPGAGKKTRVMALLRSIYGPGAERLRLDKRTFTTPTNKSVDINMITSNYHIELCPGDAGLNDRYVVQDVIKEMAQSKSIAAAGTITEVGSGKKVNIEYKVVILVEVDRLSRQAQAALRRTMEKYTASCRLILICNNPSKVIDPVRSRCLGIRVPGPSHDQICSVLKFICRKESIPLSDEVAINVARQSQRNLRRAILMLEACKVQYGTLVPQGDNDTLVVQKTDWEAYISQLAAEILREQSPQKLLAAREKLYELLVNCIPADVILTTLALDLCKCLDDCVKHEVIEWAAFYEHRICQGSKDIFHLEAFIAKFMAIYKRYLNDLFG